MLEQNPIITAGGNKPGLFEGASPKLTFIMGVVVGVAVVSLIGFVMLGSYILSGNGAKGLALGGTKNVASGQNTGPTVKDDGFVAPPKFKQCLDSSEFANKVQQDLQEGQSFGVNGTPTTFVNGELVEGAVPYDQLKAAVERALKKEPPVDKKSKRLNLPIKPTDYVRGTQGAPVTIVEYSDLECPYCKRFHPNMLQLMQEYNGKILWAYRHFPLSFHANAEKEAEATECVGKLGGAEKYWTFIDKVYERTTSNGTGFALENLPRLAKEIGITE